MDSGGAPWMERDLEFIDNHLSASFFFETFYLTTDRLLFSTLVDLSVAICVSEYQPTKRRTTIQDNICERAIF